MARLVYIILRDGVLYPENTINLREVLPLKGKLCNHKVSHNCFTVTCLKLQFSWPVLGRYIFMRNVCLCFCGETGEIKEKWLGL